ncbi:hypothetical protein PG985_005534 [Apiospora marii]|uniref:uncharacterized protein n=1 Tax=Apiospora marii TaxID=335849 RepID=UPI0031312AD3
MNTTKASIIIGFRADAAGDIPGLRRTLEGALSERLRFHTRNIALFRVSANDAAAGSKLRGIDEGFEEIAEAGALGPLDEERDGGAGNDERIELEEHWTALLNVLYAAAWSGNVKGLTTPGDHPARLGKGGAHRKAVGKGGYQHNGGYPKRRNVDSEGSGEATWRISEEEKPRWKSKVTLVVDEITHVGRLTLISVDSRFRKYQDEAQRPFIAIPVMLLFGNLDRFDPVQQ